MRFFRRLDPFYFKTRKEVDLSEKIAIGAMHTKALGGCAAMLIDSIVRYVTNASTITLSRLAV